jgi:ribokinase
MRVLNFGSLNIDYVYQVDHFVTPGETLSSVSLQENCGGKGLNQSIALAHAGVEVWHAGLIGSSGTFLRDALDKAGVHTDFVQTVSESTGHAIIQVDRTGQNSILLYNGANYCLSKEYIDAVLNKFSEGDIVLLQNEINLVGYIIQQAATRGMRVAFNAAPAHTNLLQLPLEKLSWLLVNEVEGEILTGENIPSAILQRLTEAFPSVTHVLTLGEAGSMAAKGSEISHIPAIPVDVVDTTAAGDTFTGFFLRGASDGMSLSQCLQFATIASSIAVTRRGAAASIPTYDDISSKTKNVD